jgi:hypothetical protein
MRLVFSPEEDAENNSNDDSSHSSENRTQYDTAMALSP